MRVVANVDLKRTHGGLPERRTRARKALVMHIHPLELRLAGRFLDQTYQPALDRRIARGRVAEEIFIHAICLHGPAARDILVTRPSCDKPVNRRRLCAWRDGRNPATRRRPPRSPSTAPCWGRRTARGRGPDGSR